MHAFRELLEAGRIGLELSRHRLPLGLVSAFALLACQQQETGNTAPQTQAPSTAPVPLAVANDSSWRAHPLDSLQLHLWLPANIAVDFYGSGPECLPWNRQPWLYDESMEHAVPIYFARGSLGAALQSVGIGYHSEEQSWVSYGRQGITSPLAARWGFRSIVFSGSRMVGVPISDEGGMALDETAVLTSAVRRPDGCWVIFTFDQYAESLGESELWHMMEALRFRGEDPAHALPGQPFVAAFHFDERARKVAGDTAGIICLLDPPANLRPGTPVALLYKWAQDELYHVSVSEPQRACAAGHGVELVGPTEYLPPTPFVAIGLIAPRAISFRADTLIMDSDGNGREEMVELCAPTPGSTEYRIVERTSSGTLVRYRMATDTFQVSTSCTRQVQDG
jgi:hypothetical protein